MRKLLKILCFLLIFIVLFFKTNVNAEVIECEYNVQGLKIIYDTNDKKPKVYYNELTSDSKYTNIVIAKWGSTIKPDNIDIDQQLMKKAMDNYACPSAFNFGIYTETSLKGPSIAGLGNDQWGLLEGVFTGNWETFSEGWALLNIDKKTVFIASDATYQVKYRPYLNGHVSVIYSDKYVEGRDACDFGENSGWFLATLGDIAGHVCGTAWGIGNFAWNTVVGQDGVELITYSRTDLIAVPKYDGPYIDLNINCPELSENIFSYRLAVNEYVECESIPSCERDKITKMNSLEDSLKNQCKLVLQHKNYIGGEKECIETCLSIKEKLRELKKNTDLYDDTVYVRKCGLSQKLRNWIYNIVKWVKYILPTVVIVFGILDFIKALVAEKDDEMKKAQSRFIKRLISAVLVFLIPFIIEFILEKMGFVSNSCGLW